MVLYITFVSTHLGAFNGWNTFSNNDNAVISNKIFQLTFFKSNTYLQLEPIWRKCICLCERWCFLCRLRPLLWSNPMPPFANNKWAVLRIIKWYTKCCLTSSSGSWSLNSGIPPWPSALNYIVLMITRLFMWKIDYLFAYTHLKTSTSSIRISSHHPSRFSTC